MATTVKPIEAKAVHRIQAGQVIVDLCSVVKELVENSLDAGATVLEVRFKNNGLDEIEVQDNGSGIAPANYENVALKHYTSKLATYDDLESLSTFGFRGEALSSLCALSKLHITTALEDEAPKGHRLDFESSGKLESSSIVACQRGTTATVVGLFENLPVRRKELSKNIKREYGKVLGLLHAYACISTGVKFTVKNSMPKAKSTTVFATHSNPSTRENIANVYGAKTLSALAQLELKLNLDSSSAIPSRCEHDASTLVIVKGHISKPIFGEGRQTPDRQMFFVNGRPCGLPQIAKAINEVYKSFNVSQSPFIFADFQMDTKAYDVNVSPDKRSIFLHNAAALIDVLRAQLEAMFDRHEHTLPQSHLKTPKLPAYRQLNIQRINSTASSSPDQVTVAKQDERTSSADSDDEYESDGLNDIQSAGPRIEQLHGHQSTLVDHLADGFNDSTDRLGQQNQRLNVHKHRVSSGIEELEDTHKTISDLEPNQRSRSEILGNPDTQDTLNNVQRAEGGATNFDIPEKNRWVPVKATSENTQLIDELAIFAVRPFPRGQDGGVVNDTYDRMRPKRAVPEIATITIGDRSVTRLIGSSSTKRDHDFRAETRPGPKVHTNQAVDRNIQQFSQRLGRFSAARSDVASDTSQTDRSSPSEDDAEKHGATGNSIEQEDSSDTESHSPFIGSDNIDADVKDNDQEQDRLDELDRVAKLIRAAEKSSNITSQDDAKRATKVLRGGRLKDLTAHLQITLECFIGDIGAQASHYGVIQRAFRNADTEQVSNHQAHDSGEVEEERLSLTVSKSDFTKMSIVGQFNLGFILAVRNRERLTLGDGSAYHSQDELFIIDQHASDEKFNFERLQAETVVGNQRMVRPVTLDLTAVEEEILIDSGDVLEKNGFIVDIDLSGARPIGERCQLVSLPLSKEVVFNTKDLDELVHLLAESPMLSDSKTVPRPSKVRKMFAMRACRSSIMIGKTLSRQQMVRVVQHMGTIDKPWNCPHGRPTMRHLASLDALNASLWHEGDGLSFGREDDIAGISGSVGRGWMEYASE